KHWFILRSNQWGGDPDVLEYYKHDQSKMLLGIINLFLCEQVDTNVTLHKKWLQCGFLFLIKTSTHMFYLVAETKEDMHKWVQNIDQVCGFQQEAESTGGTEDSDDALLNMTISQQEFGFTGLPDLSSKIEKEQIAYAMQMSLQGTEFGQAESANLDANSAMDKSEPTKEEEDYDVMQDPEFFECPRETSGCGY
ncbi:26S proteasome non-ATPase regulatory subunit 4, partial [Sciurus carolinensis]|nr:26S proteasome non-ATPase regulatory subunit 4 [Sciurus carolinensis]